VRNPLNSNDVNGNTMAWMADKDRENTASHEDTYTCPCGNVVPEEEWIAELQICMECAEIQFGIYDSIDKVLNQREDR
jgi:hypothetical protein